MGANLILPAGSAAADSTPADPVTRSLRFDGSSSKLTRTPSSASSATACTISFWVKRGKTDEENTVFHAGTASGDRGHVRFNSNNTLEAACYNGSWFFELKTNAIYRDPSAFYHIFVSIDTTNGTGKLFVNGEEPSLQTNTTNSSSTVLPFGKTIEHQIGQRGFDSTGYHDGLVSDFYFIDGTALSTPVDQTISSTGYSSYKPKAFDISGYSGNSFHIDAQSAHDADLLVSSIDRNDGDTLFADAAAGHTITRYGNTHHDNTVGNPFGSGTAMYFDGSGDYLQTSTSSDLTFGTGDFTVETWFYPTTVNTSAAYKGIISDELYSNTGGWAVSQRDDELSLWIKNTGGSWVSFVADGALTANQWQHIAVSYDSSTTTTRLFVDGTSVASGTTSGWNLTGDQIEIGRSVSGQEITGYLFDVRATKGEARYTSNFTAPSAPFELNPVYIGADQSGNKNHFTPTNLNSTDIREDNPFKNHATWNPLIKRSSTSNIFTYSEGNTVATYTGGVAHTSTTIASSGVHYAEFAFSGGTSGISGAGVVRARWNDGHADSYATNYGGCYYGSSGNVDSPSGSTSVSAVGSDRLGIAFDGANNKADFYSVTSGGTMTLLKSLTSSDSIDFDGSATFTATSHDTGATSITGYFEAGEWWGTAPSVGSTTATSLNTSNLDDPTVNPAENFGVALYNGNSSSNAITGLGFQPDLLWTKSRSTSGTSHKVYDSVRGVTKKLETDNTTTEGTVSFDLTSFDSDGFTLGSGNGSNYSGRTYVGWNWKAHQEGSTSYSNTLTLDVRDNYGYGSGWGTTKLEVWEGSTKLTDITNPPSSSSKIYNIKTNDLNKIKIVWYVDGSAGDWYNMYAVLKNSSNTTLASWDGNTWSGNSSDAPSDDDNFYLPSSFDSTNAATTGVVEATDADTEKYNSSAGFTIIKYAGDGYTDGNTKTLDHSLGVPLEFVIAKARTSNDGYDNGDWIVWHKELSSSKYLYLNSTSAQRTEASSYNLISTATSGSQHQVVVNNGTDGSNYNYHYLNSGPSNGTGEDYILYGWAGVEGMVKVGSWVGNGDDDGPMVYCGFRPSLILAKAVDRSNSWYMWDDQRDGYNVTDAGLWADLSNAESNSSTNKVDFLSNGFKLRGSGNGTNSSSNNNYIFIAWAHSPFAKANAR